MNASKEARPVAIADLSKHYGAVKAIDDVSLRVEPGEFVTLLGPSGSGKTTLLMMIAGFARPDAGSIRIGDREIVRLPPHKRDIGMVFQNYALFPHMTVGKNIAYPLKLRKVPTQKIHEEVARVLELVQLGGYDERRVDQLSGGQRQRVALARAIVFNPSILLMDEPLSALDKQLREHMQIEIRRLHDRLGMTTIAVTHDQREALTMSDRVAVLKNGRLTQFATPEDIYERPSSRFVAEFIGESSFLSAEYDGTRASACGQLLKLSEPPCGRAERWQLLLRPEKLVLRDEVPEDTPGNVFTGRVMEAMFQGESVLLTLEVAGRERIIARLPNRRLSRDRLPASGTEISVFVHAEDTRLVPMAD